MSFQGNCQTTAMGNMPHTDLAEALRLALTVDMPFFPQLPKHRFQDDLYVLASDKFPGIILEEGEQNIRFDSQLFAQELPEYFANRDREDYFIPSPDFSPVYHAFLQTDLSGYPAIRGQGMGPMSFGFRINDENRKAIIYNDTVREVMYDFFARKLNAQFHQLRDKNTNVFIWLDEPGLEALFTCFTGYTNLVAKDDYQQFLSQLEAPMGIHLCGNPDWSFLLSDINIKMLSMNAYGCGTMFTRYHQEINAFLQQGNIIAWGMVPTLQKHYEAEDTAGLLAKLEEMWDYLAAKGVDRELLLRQSMLTPATCCMVNQDGDATVENAFAALAQLSHMTRDKYHLA